MKILKPHCLKRGDVIGICAPASAPDNGVLLERGIRYLERQGYRIEAGRHLHKRHGYLAGADRERAEDVNRLFANRHVKAIIAVRGGYGSLRILPLLNYRTIRKNPKIFVGYSDLTALHLALLTRAGLISFSGPMVASDFGKTFGGSAEEQFWRMLTSASIPEPVDGRGTGERPAVTPRSARGRTVGGNLSLLAAMLGTGYMPAVSPIVLLLEEIDERPYRIDRMLQQARLTGLLGRSRGIALGQFIGCTPASGKSSLTLRQVFADTFGKMPVVSGLPFGHMRNPFTIPVGIRAELDPATQRLTFLESAVRS